MQTAMNLVEVLSLTPRNNCRDCGALSCLVFATEVTQRVRALGDCPHLSEKADDLELVPPLDAPTQGSAEASVDIRDTLAVAKAEFKKMGVEAAAARLSLPSRAGRVQIRCLGRVFEIDDQGELHSQCHINHWVHLPMLQMLLQGVGRPLSGTFVPFGELTNASDWVRFFKGRCEDGFQQLADRDAELLGELFGLFGKQPAPDQLPPELLTADFTALLSPLPGVDLLARVWLDDDDFGAQVSLLYDRASGDNLDAASIYVITRGLVEMFQRIARRHGTTEERATG